MSVYFDSRLFHWLSPKSRTWVGGMWYTHFNAFSRESSIRNLAPNLWQTYAMFVTLFTTKKREKSHTPAFESFVNASCGSASVSWDCPVQIIVSKIPGKCFSSHPIPRSISRFCLAVTTTSRYPKERSFLTPSTAPSTGGTRSIQSVSQNSSTFRNVSSGVPQYGFCDFIGV